MFPTVFPRQSIKNTILQLMIKTSNFVFFRINRIINKQISIKPIKRVSSMPFRGRIENNILNTLPITVGKYPLGSKKELIGTEWLNNIGLKSCPKISFMNGNNITRNTITPITILIIR